MALRELHERVFLGGRQPIGGTLRPGAVIRQRPLEGRKRSAAPLVEDATAHPEAGGHVGDRLAPEEGQDRMQTVFPGGAGGLWGGLHGGILLLAHVWRRGNFVEPSESEIPLAVSEDSLACGDRKSTRLNCSHL